MKKSLLILSGLMALCLVGCDENSSNSSSNTESDSGTDTSQSQPTVEEKEYSIVAPSSTNLSVGDILNLECASKNGLSLDGITWESSDPSVISITQGGRVKALTSGTSNITVSKGDLTSDPLTLTVEFIPVESISLTNAPKTISLGQKLKIETAISPSTANQNIELSSSSDALRLDSKAKTIEAIKLTDEEITVKAYASKNFSKFVEFKLKVNPLDETKKVKITFDTGSYASLPAMNVTKGSTIENIVYDPFSSLTDKSAANDVVFFGFYYDSSFVKPVTFPLTSTYTDMTLYGKFVKLNNEANNQYSWTYGLNEDGNSYNVEGITTYITVGDNFAFGIPAYHEGKPVTSFNKIGRTDVLDKVTHFALPNTLTSLPENALNSWKNLTYLYLPSDTKITSIPSSAFNSLKKLTSFYVPDTVTSIGKEAFGTDVSLKEIHLPDNLKELGDSAFENCTSLEELDFKSVETIGESAFLSMENLKRIHFPQNLKKIGPLAFDHARTIERITVDSENEAYSSDDFGSLYNKDKTIMYMAPNGRSTTNAYIPNTVEDLYDNAFTGSQAEFIKVPSSVKTIEFGVFGRSMNLKGVYLPKSVEKIKDNAFSMSDVNKLTIYVGYASTRIPSGWKSIWNQNTQYTEAGITTYETIYDFVESEFVF